MSSHLIKQLDRHLERRVEERVLLRATNKLFSAVALSTSNATLSTDLTVLLWSGKSNSFLNLAQVLGEKAGLNQTALDEMNFEDRKTFDDIAVVVQFSQW